jgi:hypothetical protein
VNYAEGSPVSFVFSEQKNFEGRMRDVFRYYAGAKDYAPLRTLTFGSYREPSALSSASISRAMSMKRFDSSGSSGGGFGLRGIAGMITDRDWSAPFGDDPSFCREASIGGREQSFALLKIAALRLARGDVLRGLDRCGQVLNFALRQLPDTGEHGEVVPLAEARPAPLYGKDFINSRIDRLVEAQQAQPEAVIHIFACWVDFAAVIHNGHRLFRSTQKRPDGDYNDFLLGGISRRCRACTDRETANG